MLQRNQLPSTFAKLLALASVLPGTAVRCKKQIFEDTYMEIGMVSTIVRILPAQDDMARIQFDFRGFEKVNEPFESHDFYDKNHVPCLTAKESGFYQDMEEFYVMLEDNPNDYMEIVENVMVTIPVETYNSLQTILAHMYDRGSFESHMHDTEQEKDEKIQAIRILHKLKII